MKDLTKYFIDLSKCSEEEQKHIFSLLPPTKTNSLEIFEESVYLHYIEYWGKWVVDDKLSIKGKTELTYPDFIKLFEGGEENENIYDVDFGGNVMARIKIVDNKIEVTNAMNGYGNGIPLSEITITNSNQ